MIRISYRALAILLVTALAATACGANTSAQTTSSLSSTTTLTPEDEEVAMVADEVLEACQERDRDRLRDLSGDQLRQQLQDRDYDSFFENCESFATTEQTITRDGDMARVQLRYRLGDEGLERECTLEMERNGNGPWRLHTLPECPAD